MPARSRFLRPVLPLRPGAALLLLLSAVALSAHPAHGDAPQTQASVIRFATEGADPPFNFVDSNNAVQGFEIDVTRAICAELKLECTFELDDWDSLIPDLKAGKFDAIVASLEITEERRQRIAFSEPYYRTPAVFMGRTDTILTDVTPAGLKGLRIGATENSVYAAYLDDRYRATSTLLFYANQDEASLDLALGRIDLVLGDKIALAEWLKRGREASCCHFVADAPRDREAFGDGYGYGLRRGDEALKATLDRGLEAIRLRGTYDVIRARYFPFDVK
jgi:polar amino acid transport system substrate-binding protein